MTAFQGRSLSADPLILARWSESGDDMRSIYEEMGIEVVQEVDSSTYGCYVYPKDLLAVSKGPDVTKIYSSSKGLKITSYVGDCPSGCYAEVTQLL